MANIPRSAGYHKRAIALAERLGIRIPPEPLSATNWIRLWAEIGMQLALKEPEFGPGRGRRRGSKSRKLSPVVTQTAIRKRRQRETTLYKLLHLATFRRKNDVSGIEVNGLPQNKTRRGERRA
jgi:hypothetical protein